MIEQQKTDIAEESTRSVTGKTRKVTKQEPQQKPSKKEERQIDQDNTPVIETEDLDK